MRFFSMMTLVAYIVLLYFPVSFYFACFLLFIVGLGAGCYILTFTDMEKMASHETKGLAIALANTFIIDIGGTLLQTLIGWYLHKDSLNNVMIMTLIVFHRALSTLLAVLIMASIFAFLIKNEA